MCVERAPQGRRRVGVDDEVAEHGPVQAHFAERRGENLDRDAVIIRLALFKLASECLARLLNELLHGRQEDLLVDDVEDHGHVRAFPQVGVAAGDGHAADHRWAKGFAEPTAADAQLPFVALLEIDIAAVHLIGAEGIRAPSILRGSAG